MSSPDVSSGGSSSTLGQTPTSGRAASSAISAGADEVKQAQQKLKSEGLYNGQIDGIAGPETKQALEKFQQQNGLQQTGELDQQTLSKMNVAVGSGSSSSGLSGSSTTNSMRGTPPTTTSPSSPAK